MADLLDVNVWLAFLVEDHPQHQSAVAQWNGLREPLFCRVTSLGLLRLLCNRQVMGAQSLEPEEAWKHYENLLASGAVDYAEEPSGLDTELKKLTRGAKANRDFWTDAYLAAFARAGGMRLVSFDSGFSRLRELDCLVLSP